MAKKKTTTTTTTTVSNYPTVKATAFWGIIIAGIAGLIALVVKILLAPNWDWLKRAASTLNKIAGVMNLIAQLALFISVFLAGWAHSRGKSKTWRTLFWVFAIIAFLAILGFNILNIF